MTDLRIYKPGAPLQNYIRYYWILESNGPSSILTFPIGCPQIIFHRKSTFLIPELECRQCKFTISGQVNFSSHVATDNDVKTIVIVFYPHTAGMFIGISPYKFHNCEISGEDIGNRELNELATRILNSDDDDLTTVKLLDNWFTDRIINHIDIDRIGIAVTRMLQVPSTPLNYLAEMSCLSKKQFERVFRKMVGMNVKEYSRVVRLQRSIFMLQQGHRDYCDISFHCGFADQSHFIREFKTMTGYTPTQLIKTCNPYSDLFTAPV